MSPAQSLRGVRRLSLTVPSREDSHVVYYPRSSWNACVRRYNILPLYKHEHVGTRRSLCLQHLTLSRPRLQPDPKVTCPPNIRPGLKHSCASLPARCALRTGWKTVEIVCSARAEAPTAIRHRSEFHLFLSPGLKVQFIKLRALSSTTSFSRIPR